MTKPQHKHVSAIQAAIRVMNTGLNDGREAKYHKELKRTILDLIEAKEIMIQIYRNPVLPNFDSQEEPCAAKLNPIEEEPNEAI